MNLSRISQSIAIATVASLPAAMMGASSALAEDSVFIMINNTSANMVEFYASPSTADTWEEDIFDGYVLRSRGGEVEVTIEDDGRGCIYDFLAVFDDGIEVDEYQIDICNMGEYEYTDS